MKNKIFAVTLLLYVVLIGGLNRKLQNDILSIQNILYFLGLGVLCYLLFKNTNKLELTKLPKLMAVYSVLVIGIIIYFAVSR
jgi:hypothetical protein